MTYFALVNKSGKRTLIPLCAKLLKKGADYCMALKRNHACLYDEMSAWFKSAKASDTAKTVARVDKGHGRYEERTVVVLPANIARLNGELIKQWPGLEDGCFVKTTTRRTVTSTGETSEETRYFITSPCLRCSVHCRTINALYS